MSHSVLLLALVVMAVLAYWVGKSRALSLVGGNRGIRNLHSLPSYYGFMAALWCAIPALVVMALWLMTQDSVISRLVLSRLPASVQALDAGQLSLLKNDIRNVVSGAIPMDAARPEVQVAAGAYRQLRGIADLALTAVLLLVSAAGLALARARITPTLRARNSVEKVIEFLLLGCSTLAIFVTVGIVLSVLYEALRFFGAVPVHEFVFGLQWSPQIAMRADQVGSTGAFGAVPLFLGTAVISGIAMVVAVPIGLFSAIYLAEYADRRFRSAVKPVLEILAGIPTVVYGFFAALTPKARLLPVW